MMLRVASFANTDRMLAGTMRVQAEESNLQLQEASGQVSTSYAGYGNSARKLVDLSVSQTQSQTYEAAANEASSRVTVMYDTMSSITDQLSNFRSELSAAMSTDTSDTTTADLQTAAASALDNLKSLLNTQYEGRYLFAGSDTTTAPVDLTDYDPSLDTADSGYYQGNDTQASVRVASDHTVTYGVSAGSSAFEQAFRALSAIANGTSLDDATLQSASDLVVSALDGATAIQSELSLNASALSSAASQQSDYQDFLNTEISNVRDVDVTQLSVKLTSYQTQLEASYSALAKVQSLSLVDYLR